MDATTTGLRLKTTGRSWTEVAERLGVSVPEAKAMLEEARAQRRREAAVRSGRHDPGALACDCKHRRDAHPDDGACTECRRLSPYGCEYFEVPMTEEQRRELLVDRVVRSGMDRYSLGALRQLGMAVDDKPWRWQHRLFGEQPLVPRAKKSTRYKRARRKLRRQVRDHD